MPNILTISATPYLNDRNGRINRDLLLSLDGSGHKVNSLVWHHDVQYFLPSETKTHNFAHNGNTVCELFPFLGLPGEIGKFTYEVLKICHPQVIITVGTYSDTSYIANIKAMYPHFFKWIAILTSGVNERFKESLDYAECIITTNKDSYEQTRKLLNTRVVHIPYGPDLSVFASKRNDFEFLTLNCGKNSQMSNIPAFLQALSISQTPGMLYTNLNDKGDYDLMLLMERYNLFESVSLPPKFVSVREGISTESMNELYNQHQVIVDCSTQSPTALGMLEAMATGCVPVGPMFGAVGDVLLAMAEEFRFAVPHETFVGAKEENYAIVSPYKLASVITTLKNKFMNDRDWFIKAQNEAIYVAKLFSRDLFTLGVNQIVQDVVASKHAIVVDSFE